MQHSMPLDGATPGCECVRAATESVALGCSHGGTVIRPAPRAMGGTGQGLFTCGPCKTLQHGRTAPACVLKRRSGPLTGKLMDDLS